MRDDDQTTTAGPDPASPEPAEPKDAKKRKSTMATATAKKAAKSPKAKKAAKSTARRATKKAAKGKAAKARAVTGLNAKGHREGSRKARAHDFFDKHGADKARPMVLKLGVKETTVSSWFSSFRNKK